MDAFSGLDSSAMQYYSNVSEPQDSSRAASVSEDNYEQLESDSQSQFLPAYSLSESHQFTNEVIPVPGTVQQYLPLLAKTSQYVTTEQSTDVCISSICLEQRNYLVKRIHDLSVENQNLLKSTAEVRNRLIEKELQLDLAQDSNSRLQVNFNSEIMTLRNKNWMLETEVTSLRSENNAYKEMLMNRNSELVGIHEKVNKLCELNFIGDRDQNSRSVSQDSINQNNNCTSSPNTCAETTCAIKQIMSKLDNAIQQKETILRSCVVDNDQFSQETQHTERNCMDQGHENESTEELRRQINYNLIDELQVHTSPDMCDTNSHGEEIMQQNNMNFTSQEIMNEAALCGNADEYGMIYTNVEGGGLQPGSQQSTTFFQETKTSLEEDDDDIIIITEIKRNAININNPTTTTLTATGISQNVQTSSSSISFHAMDYDRPGFTCTCGEIFSSVGKLDEHLRQRSLDGKLHCTDCDASFFSTQKLQLHMEEAHQILVLDQCKECGKVFKSRTELLRHEKSTHEYGSQSTYVNQMDFVDELIDKTGIIQQMSATSKETTKTSRLAANPHSALAGCSVDNKTPVYTIGGNVPLSLSQPQNDPSHPRHGLDAARSLPGDYFWCTCGSRYLKKQGFIRILVHRHNQQILFAVLVPEIFQALVE